LRFVHGKISYKAIVTGSLRLRKLRIETIAQLLKALLLGGEREYHETPGHTGSTNRFNTRCDAVFLWINGHLQRSELTRRPTVIRESGWSRCR
jgi:hypothetical protein